MVHSLTCSPSLKWKHSPCKFIAFSFYNQEQLLGCTKLSALELQIRVSPIFILFLFPGIYLSYFCQLNSIFFNLVNYSIPRFIHIWFVVMESFSFSASELGSRIEPQVIRKLWCFGQSNWVRRKHVTESVRYTEIITGTSEKAALLRLVYAASDGYDGESDRK